MKPYTAQTASFVADNPCRGIFELLVERGRIAPEPAALASLGLGFPLGCHLEVALSSGLVSIDLKPDGERWRLVISPDTIVQPTVVSRHKRSFEDESELGMAIYGLAVELHEVLQHRSQNLGWTVVAWGRESTVHSAPVAPASGEEDFLLRFQLRVNHIILDRRGLSTVLADIDRLENETAEQLEPNGEDLLLARRNLCGLRIGKVHDLRGSVDLAIGVLSRYESIGFDDSNKKVTMIAIFARTCLAQHRPELAVDKLAAALLEAPPGHYPELEQLVDELHRATRPSGDPE